MNRLAVLLVIGTVITLIAVLGETSHPPTLIVHLRVTLSPDEKRLLWVVHPPVGPSKWVNRAQEWLRRGEDTTAVWVSDADGTKMTLLGTCKTILSKYEYRSLQVDWLPGGLDLAVTYGHDLYRLPLNEL